MGVGTLSGWLLNENKRKATMLDTKSLVSANKKLVVVRPEPRFLGVPYFDTCPMFLKKGNERKRNQLRKARVSSFSGREQPCGRIKLEKGIRKQLIGYQHGGFSHDHGDHGKGRNAKDWVLMALHREWRHHSAAMFTLAMAQYARSALNIRTPLVYSSLVSFSVLEQSH